MRTAYIKEEWWLDFSGYPVVLWAKLQVLLTGSACVLDCDGKEHRFQNEELARLFLLEDEYTPYDNINDEDKAEYRVEKSSLQFPQLAKQENQAQKYEQ